MENTNPNEKISQSQCDRILRYLQSGKRLTSLEALDKFGCLRLSARILDLKKPLASDFGRVRPRCTHRQSI